MDARAERTVWIVNPFDNLPVEGWRPQRYWLMARAFAAAGWRVVYWSSDFSHAAKRVRRTPAGVDLRATCGACRTVDSGLAGVVLHLVHAPSYGANISLKRLYSHWRLAHAWRRAVRQERPPDVAIVSSPPLALAAAVRAYCQATAAHYVVDIQDAWPETFARVVPRALLAPLAAVARRNYRAAEAITAVASRYLALARAAGATCPMHLCYHGIDRSAEPAVPPPPAPGALRRLVYLGNMSLSYDLATVIAAVRADATLALDLAGAGPDEPALRAQAAGCARIRFHGYLAPDALRALLAQADAGIVPMFDASCVGIPGKLADYAAAGRPIINALGGETAELLARYRAGVMYTAGDAASFRAAAARVQPLAPDDATAFAVEFDARKLYNSYVEFIDAQFTGGGRAAG